MINEKNVSKKITPNKTRHVLVENQLKELNTFYSSQKCWSKFLC